MSKFSRSEQSCEIITIGKSLAEEMLEARDGKNRSVYKILVNRYSKSILRGEWTLTDQGIGFSKDGLLLNGQHRLLAVMKAEREIRSVVVYGLDKKARDNVDIGRARTDGDSLSMLGFTNYDVCSGSIGYILGYTYSVLRQDAKHKTTKDERLDFAIHFKEHLCKSAEIGKLCNKHFCVVSPSQACALYFCAYIVNKESADEFVEKMFLPTEANRGEFFENARNAMTKIKTSKGSHNSPTVIAAFLSRAWRDFLNGKNKFNDYKELNYKNKDKPYFSISPVSLYPKGVKNTLAEQVENLGINIKNKEKQ